LENVHKSALLASERRWHALRFCLTVGGAHEAPRPATNGRAMDIDVHTSAIQGEETSN